MLAMLFMDVTVEAASVLRGPAVARPDAHGRRPRQSPFSSSAPVKVMLDPSLDLDDPAVSSLLKLATHDEVVEFYDCSVASWEELQNVRRLTITERSGSDGEVEWQAATENSWHAVWLGDIASFAPRLFGEVEKVTPLDCAVAAQAGAAVGCHVYLTMNETFCGGAVLPWWKSHVGPMTPSQVSGLLSIMFRRAGLLPTSKNSTVRGGVYDCAVQRLIPSYLRLYRWLCHDHDHDDALRYLDGLLGSCAQALMALDRLACIHYQEDLEPADNVTAASQQYESASFVVAAMAALEGLAWVLVGMSQLQPDRRTVTFRRLVGVSQPRQVPAWVSMLRHQFPEATSRLSEGFGDNLAVALHFRDLLQHHVPIPVAVAEFRDASVIIDGQPRFSEKHQVGVLLVEQNGGEALPPLRLRPASGILPDAVMPYPFFRLCAHELYCLIDGVLNELAVEVDVPSDISAKLWYEESFLDESMVDAVSQHP